MALGGGYHFRTGKVWFWQERPGFKGQLVKGKAFWGLPMYRLEFGVCELPLVQNGGEVGFKIPLKDLGGGVKTRNWGKCLPYFLTSSTGGGG